MPSVLALQRHAATASTGRLLCCPPVFEAASHGANSPHKTLPFIESGRSFTRPEPASTTTATCETPTLADHILNRLEELIFEAEQKTKPLELDPYRSQLFELFVMAEGAGYTKEGSDPDLSADGLCRLLGARWGLPRARRWSSNPRCHRSNSPRCVCSGRSCACGWSGATRGNAGPNSTATPPANPRLRTTDPKTLPSRILRVRYSANATAANKSASGRERPGNRSPPGIESSSLKTDTFRSDSCT